MKKQLLLVLVGCVALCFAKAQLVKGVEYFYDNNDLGFGKNTKVPSSVFTPGKDVTINFIDSSAAFANLPEGIHQIFVRSYNDSGWSITNNTLFYKVASANAVSHNITQIEYFIDSVPYFGNANKLTVTPAQDVSNQPITIPIGSLSQGIHTLFLRSQDDSGRWSITNNAIFSVVAISARAKVVRMEWFVDNPVSFGNGYSIPVNPTYDTTILAIDLSGITLDSGRHRLFVRSLDDKGNWSITNTVDSLPSSKDSFLYTPPVTTPITLKSFTANALGNSIATYWQTATEQNGGFFIVQRSIDGFTFTDAGKVGAKGNSTTLTDYAFTDNGLPIAANGFYYRLKMVDRDGKFAYSPLVYVTIDYAKPLFAISPNPAKSYARLTIQGVSGKAQLAVYDISGKKLLSQSIPEHTNHYQLNTSAYSNGVYIVEVKTETVSFKQKLIVHQ